MIETPLRFFEVNEEFFLPDSAKFCHAKLRITPKRFDAVNMIFSSREFIFMVVNAVVLIAICYQSIVSLPTVQILHTLQFTCHRALTVNHFSFFLPRFPFGLSLSGVATCGFASGY